MILERRERGEDLDRYQIGNNWPRVVQLLAEYKSRRGTWSPSGLSKAIKGQIRIWLGKQPTGETITTSEREEVLCHEYIKI